MNREQMIAHLTLQGWRPAMHFSDWSGVHQDRWLVYVPGCVGLQGARRAVSTDVLYQRNACDWENIHATALQCIINFIATGGLDEP